MGIGYGGDGVDQQHDVVCFVCCKAVVGTSVTDEDMLTAGCVCVFFC